MKAIVFGASGTVGKYLASHLRSMGGTVAGTFSARKVEGLVSFKLEDGDFGRLSFARESWDYGIICSAISSIDECKRDVARSRAVNVVGTLRLVGQLVGLGIRPVFLSSDYVFSGEKGGYIEDDPVDPLTVYGEQKVEVENGVRASCGAGLIVRLSKVVTADPADMTMFSEWHKAIRAGRPVRCANDQFFCPTCIEDVVAGIRVLMEKRAAGVYHLCQPKRYDRASLLREFCAAADLQCPPIELCRSDALGFLDRRSRDTSMSPARFVAATGQGFTPMADCSRRFVENATR